MSDWIIQKGTDGGVSWPVRDAAGQPINLTGWSAVAQIRSKVTDRLIHTFSLGNSNIILSNGAVTLVWSATETSTWKWDQAYYGIEVINPDGKKGRLKQGLVTLSEEVVK